MTSEIKPRIDEHGVGWCIVGCKYRGGMECASICSFYRPLLVSNVAYHICEPWAREAAAAVVELKRVKAAVKSACEEADKTFYAA